MWKNRSHAEYPWKRQFRNLDFLKYEEKLLQDAFRWYGKFLKSKNASQLDEISLYVVPLELDFSWKAAIVECGDFNYFGLTPLFNSPPLLLIGLIPTRAKQPRDYQLIRVIKSKKLHLFNKKKYAIEPVIIIEDWEEMKSDKIYLDVPYERGIVQKTIRENLIDDNQISLAFQSPIISAPVSGHIGGVALSSISAKSNFAFELLKTMQMIVPPEYRSLPPPQKAYDGANFQYFDGIKFHLAERPSFGTYTLSTVCATEYDTVYNAMLKRYRAGGEMSVLSTLYSPTQYVPNIWAELLKNFSETEFTLPYDLDELKGIDIDLTSLKGAINEDLWMQVVYSKQYKPALDDPSEFDALKSLLSKDFDAHLSGTDVDDSTREFLVRQMMAKSGDNLKRIAQSLARSEEKDIVSLDHLKMARSTIIENFDGFIRHDRFNKIRFKMAEMKRNIRLNVLRAELNFHPQLSVKEIFEDVKSESVFDDIYDLQGFLDWLNTRGYVIVDGNKKYSWVHGFRF